MRFASRFGRPDRAGLPSSIRTQPDFGTSGSRTGYRIPPGSRIPTVIAPWGPSGRLAFTPGIGVCSDQIAPELRLESKVHDIKSQAQSLKTTITSQRTDSRQSSDSTEGMLQEREIPPSNCMGEDQRTHLRYSPDQAAVEDHGQHHDDSVHDSQHAPDSHPPDRYSVPPKGQKPLPQFSTQAIGEEDRLGSRFGRIHSDFVPTSMINEAQVNNNEI